MACDCMTTIDQRFAEAGHNTKLTRIFTLGDAVGMFPAIGTELVEKKRGAKPSRVIPTFCPWCGVKYSEPAAAAAEEAAHA